MSNRPCCENYETTFCPECGNRIRHGGNVSGTLLIFLESKLKALQKKKTSKASVKYEHVQQSIDASIVKIEGQIDWVKQAIKAMKDVPRASA